MFSCCALFATDDVGADMEHLKGLEVSAALCLGVPGWLVALGGFGWHMLLCLASHI